MFFVVFILKICRLLSRWSCNEALQAPSLTSSPSITLDSQEWWYVSAWTYQGQSPSVLKKPTFCPTALSLPSSLLCHGCKCVSIAYCNAFATHPGQKTFILRRCFKVKLPHKGLLKTIFLTGFNLAKRGILPLLFTSLDEDSLCRFSSGIAKEVCAHESTMERLQDSYPLKSSDGTRQESLPRWKYTFIALSTRFLIFIAMLERRFLLDLVKGQVASIEILADQQCAGSERQTLIGNGRNWTAENWKFSSWQHSSSHTLPFGFQVLFSHSTSMLPLGSLITVQVCIVDLWGNEMEWVFWPSLEDKVLQGKLHYYEVVFEAHDDLQGLRTERAHFFLTFSLSHLSLLESDGVRWSQWGESSTRHFLPHIWLWAFPRWFLAIHWERHGVFSAAFRWLRRFDWEPPILIDLPNCAAVDTELQVRDQLIEVWLDGWPKVDGW